MLELTDDQKQAAEAAISIMKLVGGIDAAAAIGEFARGEAYLNVVRHETGMTIGVIRKSVIDEFKARGGKPIFAPFTVVAGRDKDK